MRLHVQCRYVQNEATRTVQVQCRYMQNEATRTVLEIETISCTMNQGHTHNSPMLEIERVTHTTLQY